MRIVIDMQGAQTESRFRGIGRYTLSLAQAVVRNRGEHEVILALSGLFPETIEPIRAAFDGLLSQDNIRVWHAPGPVRECVPGNKWRHKVAECIREAFLASLRPDVVHVSSLFEGFADESVTSIGVFASQVPTVVTLYDLIPLLNYETYLKPNPAYAEYYQRKVGYLKRANRWLAISESAAGEGRSVLGLRADAVVNISTACDAVFCCVEMETFEKKQLLDRFGITSAFVLYSGGADARKNLPRLIRAYARLPRQLRDAQQLVLVGKMPAVAVVELRRVARSAGVREGQLLFTGYVTDDDLASLYNLCTVFVLPSCHEGFGLPALEAMSCGAAVIGSNISSIPEVIGCQDALFDPYDEADICQKLAQVLNDEDFRVTLVAHGIEQAKHFSWDESARRAISVFEKVRSVEFSNVKLGETKNILAYVVDAIAEIVPADMPDVEGLKIAHALSHIHVNTPPKQFFIDVSELEQRDSRAGSQSVAHGILKELLENPPEGYVVQPVYGTTDAPGYRYARRFVARFCDVTCDLDDEPIDYNSGDVFLGLDFQHYVVLTQKDYLSSLHRDGVSVFFVVYDLVPGLAPQAYPSNVNIAHKAWLEVLLTFDGAICVSHTVADQLAWWQRVLGPKRMRPFEIGWFPSGGDIDKVFRNLDWHNGAKDAIQEIARRAASLTIDTVEPQDHVVRSHSHSAEQDSHTVFMPFSTCSASDFLHPRYIEICNLMKHPFVWHRKLWEFVFVIHQLLESGVVKPGSKGLVFGVGAERLPAVFASMGAKIMATDAPIDLGKKKGWRDSGQHSSSLAQIRYPEIVDAEVFESNVSYQPCDMTNIQPELSGFDFNWSSCCLEHLGSLEAGIQFVIDAVEKTLRVGGIAVHTTEFNLSSNDDTIEKGDTVIYRRRDLEELVRRLSDRGHIVKPFITAENTHFLDSHVDLPPYKDTLHLKLMLMGYVSTSIGIVVQRGR